jgi:hypothetical protein
LVPLTLKLLYSNKSSDRLVDLLLVILIVSVMVDSPELVAPPLRS